MRTENGMDELEKAVRRWMWTVAICLAVIILGSLAVLLMAISL